MNTRFTDGAWTGSLIPGKFSPRDSSASIDGVPEMAKSDDSGFDSDSAPATPAAKSSSQATMTFHLFRNDHLPSL